MFPQLGLLEMLIVMGVAVMLFGKRLPEVGRSLGRGIVEFKKGLNGVADGFDSGGSSISNYTSSNYSSSNHYSSPHRDEPSHSSSGSYNEESIPKFELPGTVSTSTPVSSGESQAGPHQD